jgi:hypothetical protein
VADVAVAMSAADRFPKHLLRPGTPTDAVDAPHKNLDPVTDNCADCGATREEIDDGLAPTCCEHTGPHAEALRALFRTIARKKAEIAQWDEWLAMHEKSAVDISRHLRTAKAHLRELQASFEKLKAAE